MLKALLLMGGKSSRLGRDKAGIIYHTKPQYEHLAEMIHSMDIPVYLSMDQQREYSGQWPVIRDIYESIGPMGGILSAMNSDPDSDWMAVAVDMPFITRETISNLFQAQSNSLITTYQVSGKPFSEVLLTIYKKELKHEFVEAVSNKEYSLQQILKKHKPKFIIPDNPREVLNVNTEEELKEVHKIINNQ